MTFSWDHIFDDGRPSADQKKAGLTKKEKETAIEKSLSTQTEIKRKRLHLNGGRKMS